MKLQCSPKFNGMCSSYLFLFPFQRSMKHVLPIVLFAMKHTPAQQELHHQPQAMTDSTYMYMQLCCHRMIHLQVLKALHYAKYVMLRVLGQYRVILIFGLQFLNKLNLILIYTKYAAKKKKMYITIIIASVTKQSLIIICIDIHVLSSLGKSETVITVNL